MKNQFTDIYKKLPTSRLLEIIENRKDYQALALETAQLELASRQDIEQAKAELNKKNIEAQKKLADANQKNKELANKALKAIEYTNPFAEKSPEKSIVIICIILLLAFLFKTGENFNKVVSAFRDITKGDFSVYWFLLEYLYLPITILFFWFKTRTGWMMLLIWLIYQSMLNCFSLYVCYQFSNISDEYTGFMPIPGVSQCLFQLAFHGSLLYFICKPNVKALFPGLVDDKPMSGNQET